MKTNILSHNDKLHLLVTLDMNFDIRFTQDVNPCFYGDSLTDRCTDIHREI